MFIALALAASLLTTAHAAPPISGGFTLTTGFGATFDGDPSTLRLQIQGELPLYIDDPLGVGLVLPLELTTSGRERFGVSTSNTMLSFVPSARLRVFNSSVVRAYGDAGVGIAYITAKTDSWLYESTSHRTGFATRLVLGFEVGSPSGGVTFVIEPLGLDTLHFDNRSVAGYVGRLGIGYRY